MTTKATTSVVRAVRILELLAHSEKPMGLSKIGAALDIPKSTAHSILRDLVSESFVEVSETIAYSIGIRAFEIGSAHLRTVGTVGLVASELGRLTSALGVTSHYAVLDQADVVYLCKQEPSGLGIQLASSIGARLPSHVTAVGKSALAWLDPQQITPHIDLSDGITRADLDAELEQVRQRGYSTDDGASAAGIQCVAAPVFDVTGPKGSIGTSFLMGANQSLDIIISEVQDAAARASARLGGRAIA